MKFSTVYPIVALLGTTVMTVRADDGTECRDKVKNNKCNNRVKVSVTDMIHGLKDDVPDEVFEAFAAASAQCLECVDTSSVKALSTSDGTALTDGQCRFWCWCCTSHHCQNDNGDHYCPDQCHDRWPSCATDDRRILTGEGKGDPTVTSSKPAVYEIDVCMDDLEPLDKKSSTYSSYDKMLEDFDKELTECYKNKESFYNSWSAFAAQDGIDLSLMTRSEGGSSAVLFGVPAIDTEGAQVTQTYSSDASHQSTSQMIFYSAIGFVTVSAFAVVGTAVVVKVLNNRRSSNEEQSSLWMAEMVNSDADDVSSTP